MFKDYSHRCCDTAILAFMMGCSACQKQRVAIAQRRLLKCWTPGATLADQRSKSIWSKGAMRCGIGIVGIGILLTGAHGWAQAPNFVLVTESRKPRIGDLLKESGLDVECRDIKDASTVRASKATLKKFEKGIYDETAIRFAGLPAVVA